MKYNKIICFLVVLCTCIMMCSCAPKTEFTADEAYLKSLDKKAEDIKSSVLSSQNYTPPKDYACYYISGKTGDNDNNGKTPETAWKDFSALNRWTLYDDKTAILLERGCVYTAIQINKIKSDTIFASYGEGAMPIISGSLQDYADPALWVETEYKNVWKLTIPMHNPSSIVFNNEYNVGNDALYASKKLLTINQDGSSVDENGFKGQQDLKNDLEYFAYFQNWYSNSLNENTDFVYLYSSQGNPGSRFSSIHIASVGDLMSFRNQANILFDGIQFMYASLGGVSYSDSDNITIQNCTFSYIGGAAQKIYAGKLGQGQLGNAIQAWGNCDGFVVNNCWFYEIYDTAITFQTATDEDRHSSHFANMSFEGNLIERTHYGFEWFDYYSGENGSVKNVLLKNNIVKNTAQNFGDRGIIAREETGCDIKSFGLPENTQNFVIENNIFMQTEVNAFLYGLRNCHPSGENGDRHIEFKDNTFIQYRNKNFGYFIQIVENDNAYEYGTISQDENVRNFLIEKLKMKNPTVVFIESDLRG